MQVDVFNRLDTMPLCYKRLRIHLATNQKFDNTPTLLWVRIYCVFDSGREELVLQSTVTYLNVSRMSAVMRYGRTFTSMRRRIGSPTEGYEFHLHDLGAFLVFARVATPHGDIFRFHCRPYADLPIEFHLGSAEDARAWWGYAYGGGYRDVRKSSLSLEQMGVTGTKFFEAQRKIREKMAVWDL